MFTSVVAHLRKYIPHTEYTLPMIRCAFFERSGGNICPRTLGHKRNRWVACASMQSILLVNRSGLSRPRESGFVKPSIHRRLKSVCLGGYIYEAHVECHDILVLGKRVPKDDMTLA